MFSLGERANILKEIDQPGLVPQVNSRKYPYEVIYRSIQKLLMDTASSEYLFVEAFFGDESLLYQVFEGPFAVIDHHLDLTLTKCHDAVCLMLMICITRKHQVGSWLCPTDSFLVLRTTLIRSIMSQNFVLVMNQSLYSTSTSCLFSVSYLDHDPLLSALGCHVSLATIQGSV